MLQDQVILGEGGRFVIPAAIRKAMGIKPKDKLTVRFDDGELKLMSARQAQQAMLKEIREFAKPYKDKESMVDDFLAHRREMWGEE